uniref:Uncharacterized protein n=1 Tax=Plectus sambesii TaxID=2011161 RepID=A0A914UW48_9BILA
MGALREGLTEKRRPEARRVARRNTHDLMAADDEQASTRRSVHLPHGCRQSLHGGNFDHRIVLCAPVAAKGGIVRRASGGRGGPRSKDYLRPRL